ncbi:mannose-6-phosphate isomerase, class I [Isoptericola halotolerans]|uniref:mannose-6-phosphate isomerase n=1 Tax=Isoptericola halotolerans TaxID=300560 RepID=A0ABX2A6L7_9MICO|nr:mannose-6-phosphate isomerase, class I [Isoptericola halotolerans]NOV97563.1 mannose-6-phosphate isomerase [Isoptericola halotolerans]
MNTSPTAPVFLASAHRLENTVQPYDWGSHDHIQDLLGLPRDGRPAAELWLGAHPSAPSRLSAGSTLADLIATAPVEVLGRRVADRFGPRLPYLLKVLAARRALSLQVHPRPHQARAGYHRENRAGTAPGAPHRSFHDTEHKPEMLVALTPFEGLAGFRSPRAVLELLDGLDGELVGRIRGALDGTRSSAGLRAAMELLVAARGTAGCAQDVATTVASVRARAAAGSPSDRADATVLQLADEHPGDPGAVTSLLLNRVSLEPGEAMFVPAGEVHAYLSGLGVEVMAASDNVLRAGLTTKHVDADALVECSAFSPRPPVRPDTVVAGTESLVTSYRAPVSEFALMTADVHPAEPVALAPDGPRVVLVLDGAVRLLTESGETELRRGESCLVPDAAGPVTADGAAHLVCAWVP